MRVAQPALPGVLVLSFSPNARDAKGVSDADVLELLESHAYSVADATGMRCQIRNGMKLVAVALPEPHRTAFVRLGELAPEIARAFDSLPEDAAVALLRLVDEKT